MFDWVVQSGPTALALDTSESYEATTIRYLITLHARLAEKEPGTTPGGPTSRFIAAFFGEMRDALSLATISPKPSNQASLFAPPSVETIRNRIRELREEALGPKSLAFMDYIFHTLKTEVSKMHGQTTTH